jgi:hypothetical protein
MKALVQTEEMGKPAIKEVALPQLQENNVLVEVEYASLVGFRSVTSVSSLLSKVESYGLETLSLGVRMAISLRQHV